MILTLARIFAFLILLVSFLIVLSFALFLGLYALAAFARWVTNKLSENNHKE